MKTYNNNYSGQSFEEFLQENNLEDEVQKQINARSKPGKFIIVREENVHQFGGKLLQQIANFHKAKIVIATADKERAHIAIKLNDNLLCYSYKRMSVSQARNVSGDSSAIFLSASKNFLEHVPTVNRKPRAMIGLGVGPYALFIEVKDKKRFQARNLEQRKGVCFDNGLRFDGKTIKKATGAVATLGDLHEATHSPESLKWAVDYCKRIGVKEIFIGDTFDAASINHHELESSLYIMKKIAGGLSLKSELRTWSETMNKLAKQFRKVNIVESNHDNFLAKIVNCDEKLNRCAELDKILLLELKVRKMRDILAGIDNRPILETFGRMHHVLAKNIQFLTGDESVLRYQREMALHGDKGANGTRFNFKTTTIPSSSTGHNHTGGYSNNNFSAGHHTNVDLQGYAKGGLSSWTESIVIAYPNGCAQLISRF
jgi:hypothetical protein